MWVLTYWLNHECYCLPHIDNGSPVLPSSAVAIWKQVNLSLMMPVGRDKAHAFCFVFVCLLYLVMCNMMWGEKKIIQAKLWWWWFHEQALGYCKGVHVYVKRWRESKLQWEDKCPETDDWQFLPKFKILGSKSCYKKSEIVWRAGSDSEQGTWVLVLQGLGLCGPVLWLE